MLHLGDITKINGAEVPIVDVICGGSPCQDLSVAGKRAGLAGERSGLFMEQIRIIKEMRNEYIRQLSMRGSDIDIRFVKPRYMVWENVPGAFSSNKGEDFRAVLEETARIADENAVIPRPECNRGRWQPSGCIMGNGWSIAWRVHDAQFWGVPQRRKRIALVADFGGATAPEILFERKGVSGDIKESGKEGKDAAADAKKGIRETVAVLNDQGGSVMGISENVTGSLRAQEHGHQPIVYGISAYESNSMKSENPNSGIYEAETSRTLDLNGGSPACNQGGMAVVTKQMSMADDGTAMSLCANDYKEPQMICIEGNGARESHKGNGYVESETMYTLNTIEKHAVCVENHPNDSRCKIREDGMVQTLSSRMGTGGNNVPMVMEQGFAMQAIGEYKQSKAASSLKMRDYKDATDLVVASFYPQMKAESQCWREDDVSNTLVNGTNLGFQNGVCYGLDRAAYNQGVNAQYDFAIDEEKIGTQVAKGPGAVFGVDAVVRRLTPLECERLQGFPVVRKVRFTEMTKDEYIAWNINEGNIVVDTEYGKVFATRGPGGIKLDEPRELTGTILNGYRVVSIRNGDTKMQCRVHRIVWIAERGVIPDGYVIDHINNDKQDNRLCNLQLLTAAENSTKARADGLYKIHDDSGSAKITDEVHDFIQYVYGNTDLSIRQLAEFFGISKSRVQQIIHDEPWTDIGDWVDSKGKKHKGDADSPRYKALGNSIALPFWKWMAKRMRKYLCDEPTMASLFDGIGGFPLAYSRAGVKPLWASEIEEFPIAVTKIRFSD